MYMSPRFEVIRSSANDIALLFRVFFYKLFIPLKLIIINMQIRICIVI
jgi:hypothetical protein